MISLLFVSRHNGRGIHGDGENEGEDEEVEDNIASNRLNVEMRGALAVSCPMEFPRAISEKLTSLI